MKDNTKNILKIFIPIGIVFGIIVLCSLCLSNMGKDDPWADREKEAVGLIFDYKINDWYTIEEGITIRHVFLGEGEWDKLKWDTVHNRNTPIYDVKFSYIIPSENYARVYYLFKVNLETQEISPGNETAERLWRPY